MIEKQLRRYIAPNILAMMAISCYILADTFFISKAQGTDGITALNLTLPVYAIIFAIGAMIGIGSATRYSLGISTGQKNADVYFSNAILWDILISLIFIALGVFCPDKVLQLMGADAQILQVGTGYLKIALCFAPFFMLNYVFTAFVRNDGEPKIAMLATMSSSIFNIVFDYILMFPMGMGMTGAALATAVSPIVSMSICMTHYLSKKNTIRFRIMVPSVKKLIDGCRLGIVAFVGEIASGITTMVFNFLLLGLAGNTAVAAYGVIANSALVGTAMFNGVSQGLQPLASQAHGKGNRDDEKKIYKLSLITGLIMACIMVVGIWIFAEQCTAVFNSEHSELMAAYAVPGLRIFFVGFIVASVNIIRAGFLSATGFGKESSIIAILRGVVAIVAFAVILSRVAGMMGVWCSFLAAEVFTLVVTWRVGRERGCGSM